jgi:hypothetical protein
VVLHLIIIFKINFKKLKLKKLNIYDLSYHLSLIKDDYQYHVFVEGHIIIQGVKVCTLS